MDLKDPISVTDEFGIEEYWSFFPVLLQKCGSLSLMKVLSHVHFFCVFELEKFV